MAYDFGTNTLGIENPFKPEGVAKTITGIAICILGIFPLLGISEDLEIDMVKAWKNAALGLFLLIWGFRQMGVGIFQLFRYFVGRSVPTSLANNYSASEEENAEEERGSVAYDAQGLESMLVGRKNSTFEEPRGWLARLIHTIFPKLIFTPYPIRNFVQELAGLITISLIALVAYGVTYFVSMSGLVGEAGQLITPVFSIILLIYLVVVWRGTARSLSTYNNRTLHSKNATSLAKLLAFAIVVPIVIGFIYSKLDTSTALEIKTLLNEVLVFSAWFNLGIFVIISFVVIAASWVMINERFRLTHPVTEVSEFRENLQESVHPNEIFIHIENIVLANRRYKEIPNRLYRAFDPVLQEQSQGKGSFKGQLLIETQPEFQPIEYSSLFKLFRMASTVVSQVMIFASALLLTYLFTDLYELYNFSHLKVTNLDSMATAKKAEIFSSLGVLIAGLLTLFFSWQTILSGAKILSEGTHLFWSEMQFNSLLLWMKTEGTYTESKVSTGMSIHDSTRSENVVVRSSITPWVISSRIVTSTFATSGMKNLEMPRFIMKMSKNPDELNGIVSEIKTFLKDREAIASITNEKDLSNAETIFQVNQASRAHMVKAAIESNSREFDEQAAGKLIQDKESEGGLLNNEPEK
jgi:hypothetical protein